MAEPKVKKVKKESVPGVLEVAAMASPVEAAPPGNLGLAAALVDAADEQSGINVAPDDPYRLARTLLRVAHDHPDRPRLVSRGTDFYAWEGGRWADFTERMDKLIFPILRAEFKPEPARPRGVP